ncbi:nucleoside recognition domain-containing protein [Natranaerobius thermophilus]|uniref:Nucleoside recognition domain protein n=1 Tax=Natranaerobius thermophilus (strain ATCC BAA-1301 / DSM 18059 / JW/NM-WN-LF) TaxID=457570 RepID=B2A4P6_NATTJ|nr:nucleoside recognition domain-containing protein [Natranaerobius thermophilus]ACB85221.1 nucleoside recognition domain protein [Natranaerobius thermophilus JW/NM-WN-LF]
MINIIWLTFIIGGFIFAFINDNVEEVTQALFDSADQAVSLAIGLISIMTFWLGIMKIIERSGLINLINKALTPLARLLFPSVPRDHPAMNLILMNMSANLLGMGNAATPFGIKAMEQLQELNEKKEEATNAMCTFLAVNTSSLTLIPTAVIGIRSAADSKEPAEIVGTTVIATFCSSLAAIVTDKIAQKFS